MAKILMVLDAAFRFEDDGSTDFTYTTLVDTLQAAGHQIIKAHRDSDAAADHQSFKFDGPLNLAEFDMLWLLGDAGFNLSPDSSPELEPGELAAIARFMQAGGGVFATGDHDSIGAKMCGAIPRVKVMRKWFAEADPTRPTGYLGNWPPITAERADTIQIGTMGDGNRYFASQSDSTPQPITIQPIDGAAHPILRHDGHDVVVFPDHMHEGDAIPGWEGYAWSGSISDLPGVPSFREFPDQGGTPMRPQVIATGQGLALPTLLITRDFGSINADATVTADAKTVSTLCVYDGFRVGVGRIVTGATFHHYVDLNLNGDPAVDEADEVAAVGADAQQGQGYNAAPAVFNDIKAVYQNIVAWAARPTRRIRLILDRSTFGLDQVNAMLGLTPAGVFERAVFVTVDGFRPKDFSNGPVDGTPSGSELEDWAPAIGSPAGSNIAIEVAGVSSSDPDFPDNFQTLTFEYRVRFPNADSFEFPSARKDFLVIAELSLGGADLVDSALVQLVKTANPFMLDLAGGNDTHWVSSDVRVFPVVAGEGIAGKALAANASKSQALTFISELTDQMSPVAFEALPDEQANSALSPFPTTAGGDNVYNFAVARVRLLGNTEAAEGVRVFFRIFTTQTTSALTYRLAGDEPVRGYRRTAYPDPIAMPGENSAGSEYISFPCFSQARVLPPENQLDIENVENISPTPPNETSVFFGCLIDNNLDEPYLRKLNQPDGPVLSLSEHLMGAHQCIVAQLEFEGTPIPHGANPATSDKLSQRNIALSEIANPGAEASRVAVHTFEIEATPTPPSDDWPPDELMLEWARPVPRGMRVELYLPGISSQAVLDLANRYYNRHDLSLIDEHTIGLGAGGTRYVPLPVTLDAQPGVIAAYFPPGVKKGQRFDCLVRQVTNAMRRAPAPKTRTRRLDREEAAKLARELARQPQPGVTLFASGTMLDLATDQPVLVQVTNAEDISRVTSRRWRQIGGAFQLGIPVDNAAGMLVPNQRLLSVMKWRAQFLRPSDRWFQAFNRYAALLGAKVGALGGDPERVLATPGGIWPGLTDSDGDGPGGAKPDTGGSGDLPDYGGWLPDDDQGSGFVTGKVSGLLYDHFGDFEGFTIETFNGRHVRFFSRENAIEERAREAWVARHVVTVWPVSVKSQQVRLLALRGYT